MRIHKRGEYIKGSMYLVVTDNLTKEEFMEKKEIFEIPLPPQDIPPAYIRVNAGATVPIPGKKFHTARLDISLSYPCHPKDIDNVFELVRDWVDEKMQKEYKELLGIEIRKEEKLEVV